MAEHAAHWVDHVIPHVPTRQWVLTVPWGRRWLLARNPALLTGVHRIAMGMVERWYARQANATQEGKAGSVTVVQRFGSDIQLNLHFHSIFLDGVYCKKANGDLRFRSVVRFLVRDSPSDNIAAVHVDDYIKLEVAPSFWPKQAGNVPTPELIGALGEEFGPLIGPVAEQIPAFSKLTFPLENPVGGAHGAQKTPLLQQNVVDLRRRLIGMSQSAPSHSAAIRYTPDNADVSRKVPSQVGV